MPKVKVEEKSEKNDKASPSSNDAVAVKEEDTTPTADPPSNDVLKQLIVKLVPQVDLNRTGVKQFTKRLAAELGGGIATLKNLQLRSEFIKETLSEVINAMEEDDDDEDDEPIIQAVAHKKKGSSTASSSKKTGKPKKPFKSNLATKAEMSEALSDFLGKGKMMARTEIVRELWDYIKSHKLQNPENKREIILDDNMKAVFGVDTFTMFTMNKYIGAHVHPFKPVDLNTNTYIKRNKTGSGSTPTSAGKRKREDGDGGGSDDEKRDDSHEDVEDRRPKKKRKKKAPGLQPPYRLSPALAAVVGREILPRPQVIAALWDYIKEHDLQNPKDKREIFCDDKLKAVMDGNSKITMFNMNKLLTPHMLEKVDRSQYVHEEKKDPDKDDHDEEEEEDGGKEEQKKAEDEESDDAKDKGSEPSNEEGEEEEVDKKGKIKEEAESDESLNSADLCDE